MDYYLDFEARLVKVRRVATAVEFSYASLRKDVTRSTQTACAVFLVVVLFVWALVLCGALVGFVILASFTFGLTVCHAIFLKLEECPDFLENRTNQTTETPVGELCSVCDKGGCQRHDAESHAEGIHPWKHLKVPSNLDKAVEEFLDLTLNEYLYSWYNEMTNDECFVHQVRVYIRKALSILARRLRKVDVAQFITEKAAPAIITHVEAFVEAQKRASSNDQSPEQKTFAYYGSHLHAALRSREHEVRYLRAVARSFVEIVLPLKEKDTVILPSVARELLANVVLAPAMDAIADPDVVNYLVVLGFAKMKAHSSSAVRSRSSNVTPVEFLARFAATRAPVLEPRASPLSLDAVIKNQNILFKFMQFLKENGVVHYLQFVLAVDDLNQMVLQPELTDSGKRNARWEVEKLYKTYFKSSSAEYIDFPGSVVKPLEEILNGPVEKVVELRTSTCLFEAYDYAYNILEKEHVLLFQETDVYFSTYWGPRLDDLQKNPQLARTGSLRGSGKLKKKLESLKGVMRVPSPVEGARVEDDDGEEVGFPEDLGLVDLTLTDDVERRPDLSSLRVTIPYVDQRLDLAGKSFYVFVLEVRSVPDCNDEDSFLDPLETWVVERKFNEFYALEQKLTEFHGLLPVRLPPKFTFGTKTYEYMESRRPMLEGYLAALLSFPDLAGSELIDAFLKSEFEFTTSMFPDISLGKMIRSVPQKLLHKERGQNLEPFLSNFMASTEAPKPRPSKLEFRDVEVEDAELRRMHLENPLYENNAAVDRPDDAHEVDVFSDAVEEHKEEHPTLLVEGFYDYMLLIAAKVFSAPFWFIGMALAFRKVLRRTADAWFLRFLKKNLEEELLATDNVVDVIHLVRDLVFFDKPDPRTDQEKLERADAAWASLRSSFPSPLDWIFGADGITHGSRLIFTCFQQPKLNKQLSYVLLDLCLVELFPEMGASPIPNS